MGSYENGLQIKTVAICGASGFVGKGILAALCKSDQFEVTVLTRSAEGQDSSSSIKYKTVDYASVESLTEALRGQDAVISAIGKADSARVQHNLIDASVAAGVKRFIPSEFGADLKNPNLASLPIYKPKLALESYLEDKAAASGITYTYLYNNVILEFGLRVGTILDVRNRSVRMYDGGNHKFSTSSVAAIAQAVVQILSQPGKFSNQAVRLSEISVSQQHLLEIVERIDPGQKWTVVPLDTSQLVQDVQEDLAQGKFTLQLFTAYAIRGAFTPGFGGYYEENDNEALGVSEMDESKLEQYLARYIEQASSGR